MNRRLKLFLIVMLTCFALAGLSVGLCFLDNSFGVDKALIVGFIGVWAFFIVPSVFYAIDWAKKLFNTVDPEQSFKVGYLFGDLIFLFLIIIAPVSGLLWFVKTIKSIAATKRTNAVESPETNTEDIFDI